MGNGRSYNSAFIRQVIGQIDSWLDDASSGYRNFGVVVVRYLEDKRYHPHERLPNEEQDLDDVSLLWAMEQIDNCRADDTVFIMNILNHLQLCLRIDLVIEEGRLTLSRAINREILAWINSVRKFLMKYAHEYEDSLEAVDATIHREHYNLVQ